MAGPSRGLCGQRHRSRLAFDPQGPRRLARPWRLYKKRASSALRFLYFRSAFYLRIRREPTLLPGSSNHARPIPQNMAVGIFVVALAGSLSRDRCRGRSAHRPRRAARLVRHFARLGAAGSWFCSDRQALRRSVPLVFARYEEFETPGYLQKLLLAEYNQARLTAAALEPPAPRLCFYFPRLGSFRAAAEHDRRILLPTRSYHRSVGECCDTDGKDIFVPGLSM